MTLLNLTLAELLALFLPFAATMVALYLYDRLHRRQIVSTLRFFPQTARAPIFTRRKKIEQPWSLLLQIVSLLLLLLAIAELQFGRATQRPRDHVLILETSAWMNSTDRGGGTLMQTARKKGLDYLRAVPSGDRVMVVRADQLATPVTPFTHNRLDLETAIKNTEAGAAGLNLAAALEMARSAQQRAQIPGEIVLIGSGRAMNDDIERVSAADLTKVRAILLGSEPNDCGIRKLSARRLPDDPAQWEVNVEAFNYGASARRPNLRLLFGGSLAGGKVLSLAPHTAVESTFRLRAKEGGVLDAVLDSPDDYRADNRATVELPGLHPLKVQVFTAKPKLWEPLLASSPFLEAEFKAPSAYTPDGPPRLVILDGFQPPIQPNANSVSIAAPGKAVRAGSITVRKWNATHPIATGLHNKDVRVRSAVTLQAGAGDVVIAESDAGPVLTASDNGFKRVTFGFHPLENGMNADLAVPLLFANLAGWVSPDLFQAPEIGAGSPGLIEVKTLDGIRRDQIRVSAKGIRDVPFTLIGNRLRAYAGHAGTVRVNMPGRELVYSLNLPEVGESRWTPPAGVLHGVPPPNLSPLRRDLWPWLALAGTLGLLLEWTLYGRRPSAVAIAAREARSRAAHEEVQA